MFDLSFLIIFACWFAVSFPVSFSSSQINPLNGQHLRVIWTRWSGNPKGIPGPLKGGVLLEYLSTRLNFTYEMVRVTESRQVPSEKERGLFNYLWEQKCDLLVHDTVPTFQINKMTDVTLPWIYDHFAFLIPVPDETANINAVVKPFQWPIWLGLGISIICVIAVLNLMQRALSYLIPENGDHRSQSGRRLASPNDRNPSTNKMTNKGRRRVKKGTAKQYLYVFGNLLSQGEIEALSPSNRLPYRLVAGVWTLAAFIFVQAYTSTLFTYVVTPINHPLINSIYDIIDSSDINLLVRETGFINTLLLSNNQTGFFETLRKKLDNFPNSRCALPAECINLVKPGLRNVYTDANVYLKDAIRNDFKKTGKCNLELAKEGFIGIMSTLTLPKKSPFTQSLTKGILEMQQIGLIDYWDTWFRPMPPQCDGKLQNGNGKNKKKLSPLSLNNLTGAFVVLLVGLSLSLIVFLGEHIVALSKRHRSRRTTKSQQDPNDAIEFNVHLDTIISATKMTEKEEEL
uniref:Ionotropic glutamate receptor C-terminal domain-containing protein n=1 Tax=Daphnia galeata TaxID=27404 RepID=A0A8J2WQD0_9CRUS|nr:unnamed protein product [Daphnia galeata]